MTEFNGYVAEAISRLVPVFDALPQRRKLVYETSGLVGGDFRVTLTRGSLDHRRRQQELTVKVEHRQAAGGWM